MPHDFCIGAAPFRRGIELTNLTSETNDLSDVGNRVNTRVIWVAYRVAFVPLGLVLTHETEFREHFLLSCLSKQVAIGDTPFLQTKAPDDWHFSRGNKDAATRKKDPQTRSQTDPQTDPQADPQTPQFCIQH